MAVPGFALWTLYALAQWAGWRAGWNLEAWWTAVPFATVLVALLVVFACRARHVLLANLRQAAASRYSMDTSSDLQSKQESHRLGPSADHV
jgi:hypothetical protein